MTKTWTFIDKTQWPVRGEWDSEPDKAQWKDKATGLPCLAVRGPQGAWCGYVGVTKGHPAFGKDPEDVSVSAHGGLNFADKCQEGGQNEYAVCHMPDPGDDGDVWWLGFDCAHTWDYCPPPDAARLELEEMFGGRRHGTYRNLAYIKRACRDVAQQLAVMQ